jgi:poly-gamma-glutamate synthesis protein (capsule biosynthesis protein)
VTASRPLRLCAVGDVTAFHKEPESGYVHVSDVLAGMDVVVGQNERHYSNRRDIFPIGGFTELTAPEHAPALKLGHYDVLTFASNHLLDLGPDVLLETIGVLRELGFTVVGAGANIEEARRPAFIERDGTTFGFLAYCSVLRPNYQAGPTSPGAAPMRAHTHYHQKDWKPATAPEIVTFPVREDLIALLDDVRRAKAQCDVLTVSMHWGLNGVTGTVPAYEQDVARAAIDAGADVIHGSGPHRLKGIEIYRDRPIFYSLGNFCFDQPRWVLDEGRRRSPEHAGHMDRQAWTYDPAWEEWYAVPAENRKSLMAIVEVRDRTIARVAVRPVMINERAQPTLPEPDSAGFEDVLEYVRQISASQGFATQFTVAGNEVEVSAG